MDIFEIEKIKFEIIKLESQQKRKTFLKFKFIYFNWRLITLQYCIGSATHRHESATGIHVFPNLNSPPTYHPSGSSQCTSPKDSVSNLDWRSVSYMILYMFPSHSPKSSHPLPLPQSPEDCSSSVSLLLSHIQGYCYHLSKFHIYALVYCIGVFLPGLLHSV